MTCSRVREVEVEVRMSDTSVYLGSIFVEKGGRILDYFNGLSPFFALTERNGKVRIIGKAHVIDNVMINILSNGNRPWTVLKNVNAMFQGVKEVKLSGDPSITVEAFESNEGEKVEMSTITPKLKLDGKVVAPVGTRPACLLRPQPVPIWVEFGDEHVEIT